MSIAKWHKELLSKEQIENVHETSLDILQDVGLIFYHEPARELMQKKGATLDGERVYLPKQMVEDQLKKPPERFTLYARNSSHDVIIGGEQQIFVPVNCPAFVQDIDNCRRLGTMKDYENFVKLTHISSTLDMCSNMPVEPNDIPEQQRYLHTTFACLQYTDKCFMGPCSGSQAARDVIQMMSMVFGDSESLATMPRIISIPCSLTPLCYDASTLSVLMEYAGARQPVLVNSLAMAGSTAPVTLAGALSLQNAEILAGIVLTQLVREGTPVVYAAASSNSNLSTGALCVGSPEMAVNNIVSAQMARFYNIPSRGVGALTDAKAPDVQSGYESMMNLQAAVDSGIHFILHAAGALESMNSISYEKFVLDEELINMLKRLQRGVTVNKKSLAFEAIREVGPGGHFLDLQHTFEHFRTEFFYPEISNRDSFSRWEADSSRHVLKRANKRWKTALENFEPPDFPNSLNKDLKHFIAQST